MNMEKYPKKSEYTIQQLETRKRQLSAKKGMVTKTKNTLEKTQQAIQKYEDEIDEEHEKALEAKRVYEETQKYKEYLLLKAQETEEYNKYIKIQENLNLIKAKNGNIYKQAKEAQEAYDAALDEYQETEQSFQQFLDNYEQVNNPLTYTNLLNDQLNEIRKNREQVRQETQNWSTISRGSSLFGYMFILVTVILIFTSAGQGNLALLSAVVGAITLGASRMSFSQYNDSKKRFDQFSLRVENLQRELMGLSREENVNQFSPKNEQTNKLSSTDEISSS